MAKLTKVERDNVVVNIAQKDAVNIIKLHPEHTVSFFPVPFENTITGMEATMCLMLEKAGAYMIELHGDSVTRYEVEIK